MHRLLLAGALVALATPSLAQEQVHGYAAPFVPLAELPNRVGDLRHVEFPSFGNELVGDLPIGFLYNYLGRTVSNFGVSPDGFVAFLPNTLNVSNNIDFGNPAPPNMIVAPWWDDLALASRSLSTAYALFGQAPNRALVIETNNFSRSPNVNDGGRWQVWLYEGIAGGRFDVRLDGVVENDYNASSGYEGIAGTPFGRFLGCTPSCTATDFQTLRGRVLAVVDVAGPELVAEVGAMPRGALPSGAVDGEIVVRNLGRAAAANVNARVYLSSDRVRDASDLLIGQVTIPAIPPNNGAVTRTVNLAVPSNAPAADYHLLVHVDEAATVSQAYRIDDVAYGGERFATGYDLEPSAVLPGTGANPGEPFAVQVDIAQRGAAYRGPLAIKIYASSDAAFDPSDVEVGRNTATLNGTPVERFGVNGTIPIGLMPGAYYAIAVIDDVRSVAELNEVNNLRTSELRFATGPDLQIGAIAIPGAAPPGTDAQIGTTLLSAGVPFSGRVSYQLWASLEPELDPMRAVDLGRFDVTFTAQPSLQDTRTVRIPPSIGPGAYLVIARADPAGAIPETQEGNNERTSASRMLTHPDLRVTNVSAPPNTTAGSRVRITADAISAGPPAPGNLGCRIFLSSNSELDASDLRIHDGQFMLTNGTAGRIDADVFLPATTLVRQWTVLVQIDPQNFVIEANESNNVGASISALNVRGADLTVARFEGAPFAFVGRPYRVRGEIENRGVTRAVDFRYAVYLSDNDVILGSDLELFRSGPISLEAGALVGFDDQITIPTIPAATGQYIGIVVDVLSAVPESNELNNLLRLSHTVDVVPPSPDLVASIVTQPDRAAAGESLTVARLIENLGVQDASDFAYHYYLSSDDRIDRSDVLIGEVRASLRTGEADFGGDRLFIPEAVAEGSYTLGMILDPDGAIAETDESNNLVRGSAITVYRSAIRFANPALPQGTLGVYYEVDLFATGSPLPLSLSLAGGALPDGLSFEAATGRISGTPTREGLFRFTVRATARAEAALDRDFTLRVAPPTVALSITTAAPPPVFARTPYRAALVATGGVGRYRWSTTSELPGLQLSADGVLSGEAAITGEFPLVAVVEDEVGARAMRTLALFVLTSRQAVTIRSTELPNGAVGEPYCDELVVRIRADRGIEPYRFSLDRGAAPGLRLDPNGELCGTPTTSGVFSLVVRVTDKTGLFDTTSLLLTVEAGSAFAVSTFRLPDAVIGAPYSADIEAIRGTPPYTFALLDGALPPGLSLAESGLIGGTATATGTYAFIATASDAAGRTLKHALSIRAAHTRSDEKSCKCASGGSGSPWGLLLLGLLLLGRPRKMD